MYLPVAKMNEKNVTIVNIGSQITGVQQVSLDTMDLLSMYSLTSLNNKVGHSPAMFIFNGP